MYDVLLELQTETLTEPQNRIGDMAGAVTMLVESQVNCSLPYSCDHCCPASDMAIEWQEEVFLQRILVPEGQEVPVGAPVAVACEFEESLEELDSYKVPDRQEVGSARTLSWQSYLQSGTETAKGCS